MARMTMRKKVIITIALSVLFLFLVYNLLWFINYKSYDKFIGDEYIVSSLSSSSYSYKSSETTYSVKKPGYLSFTGNLGIANSGSTVNIIIWPTFMCRSLKEYGLAIYDTEKERGFMIYVDENMKYTTEKGIGLSQNDEVEAKFLLERLQSEVDEQYRLMRSEFWTAVEN